jgi:anti-anti-sigma factor
MKGDKNMPECIIVDRNGYFQVTDFDLEAEDFHFIFRKIEEVLKTKKQDVLISLASVNVLYSSHLALLVRIHQMMYKNNLRFGISDISPEIKSLLQLTQLDSIFSIYETIHDFENTLKSNEKKQQSEINFEWNVSKNDDDTVKVVCKGSMFAGKQLDKLQENILDYYSIIFDFSNLQTMDSASIVFLDKLADKHSVSITGVNEELIEQFKQKFIYGKIKLL